MIKSFEDLLVWQKARILAKRLYDLSTLFPVAEKFGLVDQLKRAVVSIAANIAEGFGRYNPQESIHFYRTARGSLHEVKSHLYIAFDQSYLEEKSLNELFLLIDEVGKMLNGLINQTRNYRAEKLGSKL